MNFRVLVIDDEHDEAALLADLLQRKGFVADTCDMPERALEVISSQDYDVVLTDVFMANVSGIVLCRQLHERNSSLPVIVVTGQADVDTAVGALRAGAWDFVTKPLVPEHVLAAVTRATEHRRLGRELDRLRKELEATTPIPGIVGDSDAIRAVSAMITRLADSDATVLITGESGTGKELVAQAIHRAGRDAHQPFVAINCGAIPANLLESELFGHVKGAFTDARRDRPGLFTQAGKGTIFLDEIGEMPPEMQVKLLRVLQQRTVRPIGGEAEIAFPARVMCATNRDLETEVVEGRFREDLFYRVNVVTVDVPPLRARLGDVLLLAHHFLQKIGARTGKAVSSVSPDAARKLLDYDWPGNVRELENSVERAVAMAHGDVIAMEDLPAKVRDHCVNDFVVAVGDPSELSTLSEMERRYVRRVLAACAGNKTKAAKVLGIDRRSLYRRLEEPVPTTIPG